MPGGDGTGPMGYGPRTGRGMGFCNGYNMPGYANLGFGFGRGRGFRGRGFGWRRMAFAPVAPVQQWQPTPAYQPTKEEEIRMLEDEAKAVEQEQKELNKEMEEIKKRLEELKK